MNQTPDQTVSISISSVSGGSGRENPCAACASPRCPRHRKELHLAPDTTPKSCAGLWSNKIGPMHLELNPPHRDFLPGQGIGPWSGIVTTTGQKFTADTGSVQ